MGFLDDLILVFRLILAVVIGLFKFLKRKVFGKKIKKRNWY